MQSICVFKSSYSNFSTGFILHLQEQLLRVKVNKAYITFGMTFFSGPCVYKLNSLCGIFFNFQCYTRYNGNKRKGFLVECGTLNIYFIGSPPPPWIFLQFKGCSLFVCFISANASSKGPIHCIIITVKPNHVCLSFLSLFVFFFLLLSL